MRVQMHKRRFHERAIRRVDGEPHELAWHRRWPRELQITTALWQPGAQHPYRISWQHEGLTFWAAHGPKERDGVTVVVRGPALEPEFAQPRHRFVVLNAELLAAGIRVSDAQFPFAGIRLGSRWWLLAQRVGAPDDGRGRAVAIHQDDYRTLNYRVAMQVTADMAHLLRGDGHTVRIEPERDLRTATGRHLVEMIVNATRARARFYDGTEG